MQLTKIQKEIFILVASYLKEVLINGTLGNKPNQTPLGKAIVASATKNTRIPFIKTIHIGTIPVIIQAAVIQAMLNTKLYKSDKVYIKNVIKNILAAVSKIMVEMFDNNIVIFDKLDIDTVLKKLYTDTVNHFIIHKYIKISGIEATEEFVESIIKSAVKVKPIKYTKYYKEKVNKEYVLKTVFNVTLCIYGLSQVLTEYETLITNNLDEEYNDLLKITNVILTGYNNTPDDIVEFILTTFTSEEYAFIAGLEMENKINKMLNDIMNDTTKENEIFKNTVLKYFNIKLSKTEYEVPLSHLN